MVKKKIVEEQVSDNENIEIPEEKIGNNVTINEVPGSSGLAIEPKKKSNKGISKYNSFMASQRKLIVEDVQNILKNTLLETFEERSRLKEQKRLEQEQLKKQKEEEELFEAFKKFKQVGFDSLKSETSETKKKSVPKASTEKLACEFCGKNITRHSYPKHIASCYENPEGKYADKLKHKFKKQTEIIRKTNKDIEIPEINIPEPQEEKTEKAVKKEVERNTNKIKPQRTYQTKYDDIW